MAKKANARPCSNPSWKTKLLFPNVLDRADCSTLVWLMTRSHIVWKPLINCRLIKDMQTLLITCIFSLFLLWAVSSLLSFSCTNLACGSAYCQNCKKQTKVEYDEWRLQQAYTDSNLELFSVWHIGTAILLSLHSCSWFSSYGTVGLNLFLPYSWVVLHVGNRSS